MKAKRIISFYLALIMLIISIPFTALAVEDNDTDTDNFDYQIITAGENNPCIEIVGYKGTSHSITLPAEINGMKAVGVNYDFSSNTDVNLTDIVVPEGYEYISGMSYFKNLSISLPTTIKLIDADAFYNTIIEKINFPDNIVGIGNNAFNGTRFADTDIVLPDSLEYIDNGAFSRSNITSINIGKNASPGYIGEYEYGVDIFGYRTDDLSFIQSFIERCESLTSITVDSQNPYITADNNVLYSKDKSVVYGYPASLKKCNFTIPNEVTDIAGSAFSGANFNTLTISNSILYFHENSFRYITADSISFEPDSKLKKIGTSAFYHAKITSSLVIPKSVEKICNQSFGSSDITQVSFENGSKCTEIEKNAFISSSVTKISIPSSVNKISDENNYSGVFKNCEKLTDVIFEENSQLTIWGKELFENCTSLKNIVINKNSILYSIYCTLDDIAVKDLDFSNCRALSSIPIRCFENNNNLESINLSNTNLYEINSKTFYNNTNLKKVVLPECLYSIDSNAFSSCINLNDINTDNVISIYSNVFSNCGMLDENTTASKVIKDNGEFYYYECENGITISRPISENISSNIEFPSEIGGKPVTRIDENAFSNITADSITIPETVTSICENAFSGAVINNGINLPESVSFIGSNAFRNYQSTDVNVNTSFSIPQNVNVINSYTFFGSGIDEVKINNGVLFIGDFAFNATEIEDFNIPDTVAHINRFALNTEKLNTISFGAEMGNIKDFIKDSFNNPDFSFGTSRDEIYKTRAYPTAYNISEENPYYKSADGVVYSKETDKLISFPCGKDYSEAEIPTSVKTIESYAFSNLNNTESISLPNSITALEPYAFANTISLKYIFIPNSITEFVSDNYNGDQTFINGKSLETVIFDNNISLPNLNNTFKDCKALKNVIFGDGSSVDMLLYTFYNSGIESIDLNCTSKYLEATFANTPLEDITLHKGIETIELMTFYNTALKEIMLPSTVNYIGGRAFEGCENLNFVNLSNVKGIDYAAFKNCISLESIDLTGVYYLYSGIAEDAPFYGCKNLKKFYFTAEEKDAYIAENEFQGYDNLETVVIGNSVTEIQDYAFADCSNLETALIADSVTSISDTAFEGCDNLTIVCMNSSFASLYAKKNNISVSTLIVAPIADQEYTGKPITPPLTVTQGNNKLTADKDYKATYSDNINVGTAKATVIGLGDYSIFGTVSRFNIVKTKTDTPTEKPATTVKPTTTVKQTATATPTASVTTTTAKASSSSSSNTAQKTTAKKSTTAKKTPVKKPKSTKISKLTKGKKQFKVVWKKISGVSGYQIQYSTSKKFTKETTKSVTIKGSKSTSKTIKKLKSKKAYYVRVRTYKTVKVNGKATKVYSSWSSAKSVKTK
ncbi:MAG: leucine-rich repeat protein [Eubacteriales bacterium]|nr:leucine-rich repeat protein [Eubacteriales bacterium]